MLGIQSHCTVTTAYSSKSTVPSHFKIQGYSVSGKICWFFLVITLEEVNQPEFPHLGMVRYCDVHFLKPIPHQQETRQTAPALNNFMATT